jgi:energy-coupling factor transport system permease protein
MSVDFFRPGHSILHRFDPRAKLIMLLPLFSSFFLPGPVWLPAAYVGALALVIAGSLGPRELGAPLRAIAPILILICLLTPPFHRQGRPILHFHSLILLTSDGLEETIHLCMRFTGLTLACFAVFRTLDFNDLVLSLRWFGLPFSLCLVLIVTLRYIPSIGEVWHNVRDAHKLRSGPLARRGWRKLTRGWMPLLTSVLIEAVKGIPILAMALESRGFGRETPRTSYALLPPGNRLAVDFAIVIAVSAILIAPAFLLKG